MKLDAGAQFNLHVIHTYFDLKQPQCDTYHKLKFTINQSCGPLIVTAVSPEWVTLVFYFGTVTSCILGIHRKELNFLYIRLGIKQK